MYFKFTFHGHIILSCLFIESQEFVPITFSNSKFQNKYSLCADHQNSPYYKLSDSSILRPGLNVALYMRRIKY